ncbi:MAG TPA: cbb3-type cytochrome oxidase assembly protein CcoS [Rhodocyclaceae bacterium]|nr:cbb3-type cytochrome oxidase assembly protein CcoS [Rhodocyclaceae bacterium]
MEILFLLIPLSLVLVALIGAAFWWSVKSGQFDDLEGPGFRMLMDDELDSEHDRAARAGPQAHTNAQADARAAASRHTSRPP